MKKDHGWARMKNEKNLIRTEAWEEGGGERRALVRLFMTVGESR